MKNKWKINKIDIIDDKVVAEVSTHGLKMHNHRFDTLTIHVKAPVIPIGKGKFKIDKDAMPLSLVYMISRTYADSMRMSLNSRIRQLK